MTTVREALTAKINRMQERKAALQADIAVLNTKIADLRAERDALTPADDDRFARLQSLEVIKATD